MGCLTSRYAPPPPPPHPVPPILTPPKRSLCLWNPAHTAQPQMPLKACQCRLSKCWARCSGCMRPALQRSSWGCCGGDTGKQGAARGKREARAGAARLAEQAVQVLPAVRAGCSAGCPHWLVGGLRQLAGPSRGGCAPTCLICLPFVCTTAAASVYLPQLIHTTNTQGAAPTALHLPPVACRSVQAGCDVHRPHSGVPPPRRAGPHLLQPAAPLHLGESQQHQPARGVAGLPSKRATAAAGGAGPGGVARGVTHA